MNDKFVKDSLLPDEKILASAEWHWIIWRGWYVISGLLIITMIVYTIVNGLGGEDIVDTIIGIPIAILFGIGMAWLFRFITKFNEFSITSERIVIKVGVIRRTAFELHIEHVESIEITQGILGRIFNYGTLKPCGVGASKVRVHFVKNPFEFRQNFYRIKEETKKEQNIN